MGQEGHCLPRIPVLGWSLTQRGTVPTSLTVAARAPGGPPCPVFLGAKTGGGNQSAVSVPPGARAAAQSDVTPPLQCVSPSRDPHPHRPGPAPDSGATHAGQPPTRAACWPLPFCPCLWDPGQSPPSVRTAIRRVTRSLPLACVGAVSAAAPRLWGVLGTLSSSRRQAAVPCVGLPAHLSSRPPWSEVLSGLCVVPTRLRRFSRPGKRQSRMGLRGPPDGCPGAMCTACPLSAPDGPAGTGVGRATPGTPGSPMGLSLVKGAEARTCEDVTSEEGRVVWLLAV